MVISMTERGKTRRKPKPTKWEAIKKSRVWIFSASYLAILAFVLGPADIWEFVSNNADLNEVGDFLAGLFAPLALIWLIVAVITQRQELQETRDQARQAQRVIRKQLKFIKQQNIDAKDQSIRNYKLDLFNFRYEIFKSVSHIATWYNDQQKVTEFRVDMDSYAHRSLFLFGKDVSEYLAQIAANYSAIETIDDSVAMDFKSYNLGDIYVYKGADHRKDEFEALMKKRRGFENQIQVALSYKNRTNLFSRYLDVTDATKETVADADITLEDITGEDGNNLA